MAIADTDHAIVVGISHYPDPSYGALDGPEHDAKDFADWLTERDGGAMLPSNITLIRSSDFQPPAVLARDAQPTTARIHHAIDQLLDGAGGRHRIGRRLYLYLAGHGAATRDSGGSDMYDAALLMANAAAGRMHALAGRRYADLFKRGALFDDVVLVMDCCRGGVESALAAPPPYSTTEAENPSRHFYAFATEWRKSAWEGPWGPGGATRGLFTAVLLDGLRGKAPPNPTTGLIDSRALADYVRRALPERDPVAGEQRPQFHYSEEDAIVFGPSRVSRGVIRLTSATLSAANVQLQNGTNDVFSPSWTREHERPAVWEWEVPLGLYKLIAGTTSEVLDLSTSNPVVERNV